MDIQTVQTALRQAEEAIERAARHSFEEYGSQLKFIRDNRLYIAFAVNCTWEQYTQDRWEMTPQRAGQLIQAFEILDNLKPKQPMVSNGETTGFIAPSSERQIRPLAALPDAKQRAEVWQHVIEFTGGLGITAKVVEAEVERYKAALNKNYITLDEWNAGERWYGGRSVKSMNKQDDENIEWAAWSWNPVTGCLHNCDYCYARDIANRFYPYGFQPAFIPERLDAPANTKQGGPRWKDDIGYRNVFTCSMADLFGKWVPEAWIQEVLAAIESNPQWTFLLLTKFPVRMAEFTYPANVWLGTTVDKQYAVERAESAFRKIKSSGFAGVCWLSCEPMLESLTFSKLDMFDWVVMGGASKSTRTPEMRPPFDDVVNLYEQARAASCRVYMKTNLGIEQRIREYPND